MAITLGFSGCGNGGNSNADKPQENKAAKKAAQQPQADSKGAYHCRPGDDIQSILDAAASDERSAKLVLIHAGTYAPKQYSQALLHFNQKHHGVTVEGVGEVILTAANPQLASREREDFPAMVNHVVFFGDAIGPSTTLRGLKISGANGFAGNDESLPPIEPRSAIPGLKKGLFFYMDGGGIKIFGRSCPTIENVTVQANKTRLCGAGVSIEQQGLLDQAVIFRNCIFRENSCPATGSAIDVLEGSSVELENCLLVGNISNSGMDAVAEQFGLTYKPKHGCGALTVFPNSRAKVRNCTFTENWNGVDDAGNGSIYEKCIFWHNEASDGSREGAAYELDITDASGVTGCMIGGEVTDLQKTIDTQKNELTATNPDFDEHYQPRNVAYQGVGFRNILRHPEPN